MLELRGHTGPVLGLAYSPDGKTLASASADGSVRLWDVQTGKFEQKLRSGEARAHCVSFSSDGELLAAGYGGDRGMLQIWDWRAKRRVVSCAAHERATRGIAFGDEPNWIATCGDRPNIAIWQLPSLDQKFSLTGYGAAVALSKQPPRRRFATITSAPARLQFWEQRKTLFSRGLVPLPSVHGYSLEFSPTERLVACGTEGAITLTTSERKKAVAPISWQAHEGAVLGVRFLPDGQSLLSAATDGLVRLWSLNGVLFRTIDWQIGELGAVAVAPDGLTAAVGGAESIVIWDLDT